LILEDVARCDAAPAILDIGCGQGVDGDRAIQATIAARAGRFIGVEPDPAIALGTYFTEVHHCLFEQAPIPAGSIEIAYCVMVLEHLPTPETFWNKLHDVLADGGVFWALTVDARHPFCGSSRWLEQLRLKDLYLNLVFGRRGIDRHENYPTYYRSNTPEQLEGLTRSFSQREIIELHHPSLWSSAYPRVLRPFIDALERRRIRQGRPGINLILRVVK
jgi:SAM-dependent methyltransferase